MKNQEIRIGLIGSQSMHARAFGQVCNEPDQNGNYRFPNARVTAVYGVDDTPEHCRVTMEKGNIPHAVSSTEELYEYCNAFMILHRRGSDHVAVAEEIIQQGYPVFIDKPICTSSEDMQKLKQLAAVHDAVICGGSGFKYNRQILQLKEQIAAKQFGQIREATITYNADIDSPYDGIFFYLPHAVEIMLELFGYDPRSVAAEVSAHDQFIVYVTYEACRVRLVLNGSKTCRVEINGNSCICEEIDAGDIFVENMRHFLTAIETGQVTKDTAELTKHVRVILAVKSAIENQTKTIRI
ncbi:MAG: Gfo/Idh/MocA family oxidoreductase [Oscillospiraceae bacterium]|nr:Gfo/Idh/MocA family oxidoreductase [Oscillospiraceae bacterium]